MEWEVMNIPKHPDSYGLKTHDCLSILTAVALEQFSSPNVLLTRACARVCVSVGTCERFADTLVRLECAVAWEMLGVWISWLEGNGKQITASLSLPESQSKSWFGSRHALLGLAGFPNVSKKSSSAFSRGSAACCCC